MPHCAECSRPVHVALLQRLHRVVDGRSRELMLCPPCHGEVRAEQRVEPSEEATSAGSDAPLPMPRAWGSVLYPGER